MAGVAGANLLYFEILLSDAHREARLIVLVFSNTCPFEHS